MPQKLEFNPFPEQYAFLSCEKRITGAFAGKRGGKTEAGAIKAIQYQQQKPNWIPNGIDPYLGVIIAPTFDMLRRLSMKKFLAYAEPAIKKYDKSRQELKWYDDSEIYGLSGENSKRIEGIKANWIWIDEVFQVSEELFLEAKARISDSRGYLFCTGSLGVQYVNPKLHWAYKYFKINPDDKTQCFEWSTAANPYFPQDELESLKNNLDPRTYRQMFEIDWDITPQNAVYSDLDEGNITRGYTYNPNFETYVSIDWGFAHPMACLYFQYDRANNIVYLFDEIVMSQLKLDKLWSLMQSKPYKINGYCCDTAGNQEREQTAISNIKWFRQNAQINFKYGSYPVLPGIAFVRSYIKNGLGQSKFIVDEVRCPKSLDSLKQYKYAIKDGMIKNENPEKLMDDPCDSIRYFFENFIKPRTKLTIEIG